MKFAFVILNYNVTDETINCIESIKKIDYEGGIKYIIVVDNASNNQDVFFDTLKQKYAGDDSIVYLRSRKNTGYARGNNMGIHYAKNVLKADFVCVLNPDVTITQDDFVDRCISLYNQHEYAVLGVGLSGGYRDNAWCYLRKILERKRIYIVKKFDLKRFNFIKKLKKKYRSRTCDVQIVDERKKKNSVSWNDIKRMGTVYLDRTMHVTLVGCCLVFSPTFFHDFTGFCNKTFMYGEEYILASICFGLDYRMLYSNEIKIQHENGKSVQTVIEDTGKGDKYVSKMYNHADFIVMKMHMRKYDKKYLRRLLNANVDEYDVV
jgi:GT2 family glycosyltransferase